MCITAQTIHSFNGFDKIMCESSAAIKEKLDTSLLKAAKARGLPLVAEDKDPDNNQQGGGA